MVRTVPWMMALAESTRLRMAPDASFTMPFSRSNWPAATVASALQGHGDQAIQGPDGELEGLAEPGGHVLVGLDRQFPIGETDFLKVLPVGLGPPRPGVVQEVRHVGDHLQRHDDLVEIVEVVGGEKVWG